MHAGLEGRAEAGGGGRGRGRGGAGLGPPPPPDLYRQPRAQSGLWGNACGLRKRTRGAGPGAVFSRCFGVPAQRVKGDETRESSL